MAGKGPSPGGSHKVMARRPPSRIGTRTAGCTGPDAGIQSRNCSSASVMRPPCPGRAPDRSVVPGLAELARPVPDPVVLAASRVGRELAGDRVRVVEGQDAGLRPRVVPGHRAVLPPAGRRGIAGRDSAVSLEGDSEGVNVLELADHPLAALLDVFHLVCRLLLEKKKMKI